MDPVGACLGHHPHVLAERFRDRARDCHDRHAALRVADEPFEGAARQPLVDKRMAAKVAIAAAETAEAISAASTINWSAE